MGRQKYGTWSPRKFVLHFPLNHALVRLPICYSGSIKGVIYIQNHLSYSLSIGLSKKVCYFSNAHLKGLSWLMPGLLSPWAVWVGGPGDSDQSLSTGKWHLYPRSWDKLVLNVGFPSHKKRPWMLSDMGRTSPNHCSTRTQRNPMGVGRCTDFNTKNTWFNLRLFNSRSEPLSF